MENKENRIRARIVVEIDGYLDAPLLVGSGEDEKADMDQLLTCLLYTSPRLRAPYLRAL